MTKEEREKAIDLLDNLLGMVEDNQDNDYDKALKMGIESLRKEPCEDVVSRKAVLNTLDNMDKVLDEDRTVESYKALLKECYEVLPPVTPTRKKGKWINIMSCATNFQDQIIYQCVCDSCSSIAYFRKMCGKLVGAKYCPNCEAKMEVEE